MNQPCTVCLVCFDAFGSNRQKRPRILTCGHSFCHNCLKQWWSAERNACPSCKENINYLSLSEVPINYQLQDAAKEISRLLSTSIVIHPGEKKLKYEGLCIEHNSPNHFKCLNCLLFICGTCQFVQHKKCQVVLYDEIVRSSMCEISDSINNVRVEYVNQLEKTNKICEELKTKMMMLENDLETWKMEERKKEKFIKNLKQQQESLKNCKTVADCEKIKIIFQEIQSIRAESLESLDQRFTVLDPSTFCKKNNVNLWLELKEDVPLKYGRIEVGSDDRIRIHQFEELTLNSPINSFQFDSLLSALNVEEILPLEAFFKVYREYKFVGEFIVKVNSLSPRGINFILGASGILHDSYYSKTLKNPAGNFVATSDNFPALVEGIQYAGNYSGEKRRGSVCGTGSLNVNNLSLFGICKIDSKERIDTMFGHVTRGIEIVDQIKWNDTILECGLII